MGVGWRACAGQLGESGMRSRRGRGSVRVRGKRSRGGNKLW
jgi:hypothetical protein